MLEFLTYDAKVAVLIVVFYLFYRLLLARETFHRVNRVVMLSTAVASFLLPLCVITIHHSVVVPMPSMEIEVGDMSAERVQTDASPSQWLPLALTTLYIIGVVATLSKTLLSLVRLLILIRQSEQHPQTDGTIVCVAGRADLSPFSWMRYIVMSRADYERCDVTVLAHERGHIRLHHSWDLLLVDPLSALQWFNPVMWMLRADLRELHEYEADAAVLSQGINVRQYQYLLVTKAAGVGGYSLANGISHSTLKNRITMMLHTKSSRSHLLKLLALLPIVGIALYVNAETVVDVSYRESQLPQPVAEISKTVVPQVSGQTVEVVNQTESSAPAGKKVVVKGRVFDAAEGISSPIIGAVVALAGSTQGGVTDREGRFELEAAVGNSLSVMYVGYETTTVTVIENPNYTYAIGLKKDDREPQATGAFDVVESMPQFPGGTDAMMEFIRYNLRYPADVPSDGTTHRAIVQFVVEADGSISGAKVVKSAGQGYDAQALRLVNAMPKWTPGRQNGKAVPTKYTMPVTFHAVGSSATADEEGRPSSTARPSVHAVRMGSADVSGIDIEVDGRHVTVEEMNAIDPSTIESMQVIKNDTEHPNGKIVIKLKKK